MACLAFLALLGWPYVTKPAAAISTYYVSGVLNPLFGGLLVLIIPLGFLAIRTRYLTEALGSGIVLGLSLAALFITAGWAVTTRLDVVRASGWVLPAQRFLLVALALLIAVGTAGYVWKGDLHIGAHPPATS